MGTVLVEIDSERVNRIRVEAPFHYNDLIKTLPGSNWSNASKHWSIPLSWTSCLGARSVFGSDLEIGPRLKDWALEERRWRIDPGMRLRDALDVDDPALAGSDNGLYPHQRAGAVFLATVERGMLFDDPGAGKTRTTIHALQLLYARGFDVFPMLIVCPNTVKRTWERELAQWWPETNGSVQVVDGTAAKRRKQLESGARILIANWEALRTHSRLAPYGSVALKRCRECGGSGVVKEAQCQVHQRELNRIEFNTVIADEAHRIKNPKSLTTLALRGATGDARFRYALTGTPISNAPSELWPLLNWIDPDEWPSRTKWIERLIQYSYNVWGGMEITGIKPEAEAEFRATVEPRMRRMTKEVVLPFLPEKVFERRDVDMTPVQKKAYSQMEDELVASLDSGVLLSANPMVQAGRLIQFASSHGDLVVDDNGEERLQLSLPSSKISAFMDDLDDFEGQQIVVFAESRQLIELLSGEMQRAGHPHGLITGTQTTEQRQRAIEDFQKGNLPAMLCTIKAGGVGITLTAASTAVFLQRSWSPIDMAQAHDRIHRIGSEIHESVLIVDYVAPDTIEEAQIWALKNKRDLLQEIVRDADLMRRVLKGEFRD